jgi:nicotinamidase-related amidase
MPSKNSNLHGNTPEKADVVLLLIDVINDLDFAEADELLRHALPMAERLRELKSRAKKAGIPAIYVNDNFGRWRSDFRSLVDHCSRPHSKGRPVVELLMPDDDDYFVLKPKHSGFFSTVLDVLLTYLEAKTLIVTGIATNICVLFTANDAYLRDYQLCVPSDCVAANTAEVSDIALEQLREILKADTAPSAAMRLETLLRGSKQPLLDV